MVAIGTSNDFLCRKIKTASFQKQITPFSIDDILANPRPIGKEETNEKSTFDCPHHFHPGSVSLSSLNQDMHLQWLANLHRLCMLSACQPFWYSTLTIDRKHFLANNRIFGDSSRHHFFNLESYTKIFKSSSEVSARPKEVRKRKRSDNIKSVRSNSSPKLFKIGQNLKTEKPDLRSPSISSFETDNGQTEDRPISNETSGLDSPLSALEKLTSATFIGMEKSKNIPQAVNIFLIKFYASEAFKNYKNVFTLLNFVILVLKLVIQLENAD